MTQPPFPPGTFYPDPTLRPPRTNSWAVASFVCSLVFCVPLISGLLGVIFGIVGLRAVRTTNSGRGLSIAGIVLGLLFVVGWSAVGVGTGVLYVKSQPVREQAKTFIKDAVAGNTAAALGETTGGITAQEVNDFSSALTPMGSVKSISTFALYGGSTTGPNNAWLVAVAIFFDSGKNQIVKLTLVKVGAGYKVQHISLQPTASTNPPTAGPASTSSARLDQTPRTADPAFAAAF